LILRQKGTTLHIVNSLVGRSYCGKYGARELSRIDLSFDSIVKLRSGHAYGKFLVKKATCGPCKVKARKEIRKVRWYTRSERTKMYEILFEPVPTPRPLPKKQSIGGVNKMMSNIRERLRRRSDGWTSEKKLFVVKTDFPKFVAWGEEEHHAFLAGVNFAIDEVFNDFKLEKYDRYLEDVYRDLHQIVTGEELPTEKDERNES